MPKYNFMVSRAVDLVARKLAGLDTDTVSRLTQILGEEAQAISEELQYSGQPVDSEVLAARLEGVVARMKYEVKNKVVFTPLLYLLRTRISCVLLLRARIHRRTSFRSSMFRTTRVHRTRIRLITSTTSVTRRPTRLTSNPGNLNRSHRRHPRRRQLLSPQSHPHRSPHLHRPRQWLSRPSPLPHPRSPVTRKVTTSVNPAFSPLRRPASCPRLPLSRQTAGRTRVRTW